VRRKKKGKNSALKPLEDPNKSHRRKPRKSPEKFPKKIKNPDGANTYRKRKRKKQEKGENTTQN